jgi:DNA topoisomerase-2
VLEVYLSGSSDKESTDKTKNAAPAQLINDYKEYHTDCTVRFIVKMSSKQYQYAMEQGGLHKFFKLQKTISLNNMVLFDSNGCLRRYETPIEILREFYDVRYRYYAKRKEYLESMMGAESGKYDNIARFIMEKIEGKIKIENLKKSDLIKLLVERGYQSDPVRKWKEKITKEKGYLHESAGATISNEVEESDDQESKSLDFNYLLSMPLINLTLEKKEEILKQQKAKASELKDLQAKSIQELWLADLNEFKEAYEKSELKEKEDFDLTLKKAIKSPGSTLGTKKSTLSQIKFEYLPSPDGERVEPKIDAQTIAKVEKDAQQKAINKVRKEETLNGMDIVDIITSEEKLDEEQAKRINELASNLGNPNKAKAKPAATPKKQAKGGNLDNSCVMDGERVDAGELSIVDIVDAKPSAGNGAKKSAESKKEKTPKKKEKITVDSGSEKSFDDDFPVIDESLIEKRTSGRSKKSISYNINSDDSDNENNEVFSVKDEVDLTEIKADDFEDLSAKNGGGGDENGSTNSVSDLEEKPEIVKSTPKKRQPAKEPKKPAAKKTPAKKLTEDDESDGDEDFDLDKDEDSDFEFGSAKKKKTPSKKSGESGAKAKAPAAKKPRAPKAKKGADDAKVEDTSENGNNESVNGTKLDSDDELEEPKAKKPKKAPAKKEPAAKKAPKSFKEEDDDDFDDDASNDDDSDFEFGSAKKKKGAKKEKNDSIGAIAKSISAKKAKATPPAKKAPAKKKSTALVSDSDGSVEDKPNKVKKDTSVYDIDEDFSLD